jgi:hypothetical protein
MLLAAARRAPLLRRASSKATVDEVNRVMAAPEDSEGNPVALDFSSGKGSAGFSRSYAARWAEMMAAEKEQDGESDADRGAPDNGGGSG